MNSTKHCCIGPEGLTALDKFVSKHNLKDTYSYVASPYSDYRYGMVEAYNDISAIVEQLYRLHIVVISPIVSCHDIAVTHGLPTNAAFWEQHNRAFVKSAKAILVVEMFDWIASKGVNGEIEMAQAYDKPRLNLPIHYYESAYKRPIVNR